MIENFEYDALRDFYHKWYRTDLQAIAIVGDFDAEEMENKVIDRFSHIPPVENAPERPFYEIPDHQEMIFGLVTGLPRPMANSLVPIELGFCKIAVCCKRTG